MWFQSEALNMRTIKYRAEIDGLRALAVLPVLLFHLNPSLLSGGFIGVDVFFVISGFLITSIILKEQAAGDFTFSGFWMRRIRRIMPAMLTMLIATSLGGYFILFGPYWHELGRQVLSALFIYANVEMWQATGNYWGIAAEAAPLLHTWSLSVEEQFYLFYPLFLLLLLKVFPKRIIWLVLCSTILSFLIGVYAVKSHPNASFYLLPTRAWELAAGCLVAIFQYQYGLVRGRSFRRVWASIGVCLISAGYFVINGSHSFPGFWALLPVIGTVLVIRFAGQSDCLATRALSLKPVVYIGKCSYSLYLWHWPVIVLTHAYEIKSQTEVGLGLVVLIIVICTLCSYYFVEKPARHARKILLPIGIATSVCVCGGVLLLKIKCNYELKTLPAVIMTHAYNLAPKKGEFAAVKSFGIERADVQAPDTSAFLGEGVQRIRGEGDSPEIVVLGDSHGGMWAPVIDSICEEENFSVAFFIATGTNPMIELPLSYKPTRFFSSEEKYRFDSNRLEKLQKWRPKVVVISARWDYIDLFNYDEFMQVLEEIGAVVIFLEQPPVLDIGDVSLPLYLAYSYEFGELGNEVYLNKTASSDSLSQHGFDSFVASYPFARTVKVSDLFERGGQALVSVGKVPLYADDDHLSLAGAMLAKPRIEAALSFVLNTNEVNSGDSM
jgi:peptidoglycan/LPS O-acetylase OafA/YrhL